jgi:hypothetical protein
MEHYENKQKKIKKKTNLKYFSKELILSIISIFDSSNVD